MSSFPRSYKLKFKTVRELRRDEGRARENRWTRDEGRKLGRDEERKVGRDEERKVGKGEKQRDEPGEIRCARSWRKFHWLKG
jgi:hypothetical protein